MFETVSNALKWRFATKNFDPKYIISENQINSIIESIELCPTSFGLQAFKVFCISESKIKNELYKYSYKQDQINTCSTLLVFCSRKNIDDDFLKYHIDKMSQQKNKEECERFFKQLKNFLSNIKNIEEWLTMQVYIALGIAIDAASFLKIDNCPIEGFDQNEYDKILKNKDYKSKVLLALGKRDDKYKVPKKFRRFDIAVKL